MSSRYVSLLFFSFFLSHCLLSTTLILSLPFIYTYDTPFSPLSPFFLSLQRVEHVLQGKLESDFEIRLVRNVAPKKDMYCCSFDLPKSIAFATDGSVESMTGEGSDRGMKKVKLVDDE